MKIIINTNEKILKKLIHAILVKKVEKINLVVGIQKMESLGQHKSSSTVTAIFRFQSFRF